MENTAQYPNSQNTEYEPIANHYWIWIGVVALLLVVTGVGVLSLMMKKNQTRTAMNQQDVVQNPAVQPLGLIQLSSESTQSRVGQTTQFTVKADSGGAAVVGFDILITYNPDLLTVNQVAPVSSEFQISSFTKRKGEISITGTKISSGQTAIILSNIALVTVSVTALKPGTAVLDVKPTIKNETTKFIDARYKQYSPQPSSLQIEIL